MPVWDSILEQSSGLEPKSPAFREGTHRDLGERDRKSPDPQSWGRTEGAATSSAAAGAHHAGPEGGLRGEVCRSRVHRALQS